MKRLGNLWDEIASFENLLLAARKAQRGKRFRESVLDFNYRLEENLLQLQAELLAQTYQPGSYHSFWICEPKPRIISAAPYRDRIVHHALCNVIVPPLERSFISDSYANRKGYGTHRALRRFIQFARSSRYVLQCDIKKYFPSICRPLLKQQIRERIKCPPTLNLIDSIIDNSSHLYFSEGLTGGSFPIIDIANRGLPIGNLTSQFFANLYLNKFDHFIKQKIHCKKYLRYVDDLALFSDDRQFLADARLEIESYLATLQLEIHPIKSQLFETKLGANFVGFRVLPDRVRVRNDNLRRGRKRMKELQYGYAWGQIGLKKLVERLQSWEAHLAHGDTYRLRRSIFDARAFALQISDIWPARSANSEKKLTVRRVRPQ